jgi:hypothetical protein
MDDPVVMKRPYPARIKAYMKVVKHLLSIVYLINSSSFAFGQGEVLFSTRASALTRISTNSVLGGLPGGLITGAGDYYFGLFYAPSTVTTVNGSSNAVLPGFYSKFVFDDTNWTFSGAYGTNTAAAGRFRGVQNADGTVSVPGYPAGDSVSLVILGWSADIGPTVDDVRAFLNGDSSPYPGPGFIGESAVATIILGGPDSIFPVDYLLGTGPGHVSGFTLGTSYIPEPCTLALIVLGGAGTLFFRRRK